MANLRALYNQTKQLLGVTGYLSQAEKVDLQQQLQSLRQSLGSAPASIFLLTVQFHPMVEVKEPPRWSEPRVRALLHQFFALLDAPDTWFPSDPQALESDSIYQRVVSPDIKRLFRERRGRELYRLYENNPTLVPPSPVRALVIPSRELALLEQRKATLDGAPDAVLAAEAGVTQATVRKAKKQGLTGSEIVDIYFTIRVRRTTGQVARELVRYSVPIEDWEDVLEVADRIGFSARRLVEGFLSRMEDLEELLGAVDEFSAFAYDLIVRHRKPRGWAWWVVLSTYLEQGERNIDRTWDALASWQQGLDKPAPPTP